MSPKKAIAPAPARRSQKAIGAQSPTRFTLPAGGTESDNWALVYPQQRPIRRRASTIITTKIEHHAVLHTCEYLEQTRV
ncbi:MAG: hypothetical protein ACLT76_10655 [Clostridium fessum]